MKQDSEFKAGPEAVLAMSKATEYFGEFILQEIKKQN